MVDIVHGVNIAYYSNLLADRRTEGGRAGMGVGGGRADRHTYRHTYIHSFDIDNENENQLFLV